ncbi:VOC family protein [Clostridium estertheticum]|uniref:VOC family protein n=1 Tax=Clostridium estertheticum TaxID=238834 RepID=UPI001CF5D3A9|nr:VOC family protein [Clostridium estertheticum]MCB2357007.1 VOC family protein [Clostridium estertheticum]WAG43894.1 VOC family protein [Clostridium estertheticum]
MIKGICIGNIAIDCKDAVRLRNFYAELLGWESCIMYNCPALHNQLGLVLLFMEADFEYVKPVFPEEIGKQQKQMHFDFQVDDLRTAVLQAEALGACKAESQFGGNDFVTMFDPEGHPFCLCAK